MNTRTITSRSSLERGVALLGLALASTGASAGGFVGGKLEFSRLVSLGSTIAFSNGVALSDPFGGAGLLGSGYAFGFGDAGGIAGGALGGSEQGLGGGGDGFVPALGWRVAYNPLNPWFPSHDVIGSQAWVQAPAGTLWSGSGRIEVELLATVSFHDVQTALRGRPSGVRWHVVGDWVSGPVGNHAKLIAGSYVFTWSANGLATYSEDGWAGAFPAMALVSVPLPGAGLSAASALALVACARRRR